MRKSVLTPIIVIMTVLMIVLSGCKQKAPETQEPVKEIEEPAEEVLGEDIDKEAVMEDFNNLVENEPDKIVTFIDKEIGKLSDIEGDQMVLQLEKSLEKSLDSIGDKIIELDEDGELIEIGGSELFFLEDKVKDIRNDKLRQEVEKALNSKYKLINLEGTFYPIIDYEKIQEYNNNISPELKDYLAIKAMDSNKPVAIDGALYISLDELSERILKAEDYLQRYSGGQRHEEMLKNYKGKLELYLLGLPNTPIADYETSKIEDKVLESYKDTVNTKDKITAHIVRKYLSSIEANEYIIDESVTGNIVTLVNEALSLLKETK